MIRLLSCDHVFEILTRGPFPAGEATDHEVERHLRSCHECRQLAEALRPAVALLHEAVSADESLALPEYKGSLPELVPAGPAHLEQRSKRPLRCGLRKVERAKRPGARRREREFDYSRMASATRLIAASILIASLATLSWGLATSSRPGSQAVAQSATAAETGLPRLMPDQQGLITLVGLKLPSGCFPAQLKIDSASGGALPADLQAAIQCCTVCHHATAEAADKAAGAPNRQVAAISSQSCKACHRS